MAPYRGNGDKLGSSPIPKAGKGKQRVATYRPIALTSHISKLAVRIVLARLTHLMEHERMVPAEQVGFTAGWSVKDNIGRLAQQVQDGWNIPKFHRKQVPDGSSVKNMASWPSTSPGLTTPSITAS